MPIISVIVPVYKVEPYIRRCIDSILSQTFTDFELILVDDGSPDNCPVICDEYALIDSRIHVIHQKNRGLSAARNAGLDYVFAHSDSEWISFVDSDDWVHPQFIELLYQGVKENKAEVSVCLNSIDEEFSLDKRIDEIIYRYYTFEDFFCFRKKGFNRITAWAKLYKKDLFMVERFPVNKQNEDLYTIPKVLHNCKIAIIEAFLYHYFQSEGSITRKQWNAGRLDEIEASEELVHFFNNKHMYRAETEAIDRCFWVINRQKEEVKNLSKKNRKKAIKIINKKYKKILFRYRTLFSFKEFKYKLIKAYPMLDWCYWTCAGIFGKVIRAVRNDA